MGNVKIEDKDVQSYFDQHCVGEEDYRKVSSSWKNHKGFCVGWKIQLVEKYDPPNWIPWKGDPQSKSHSDFYFRSFSSLTTVTTV